MSRMSILTSCIHRPPTEMRRGADFNRTGWRPTPKIASRRVLDRIKICGAESGQASKTDFLSYLDTDTEFGRTILDLLRRSKFQLEIRDLTPEEFGKVLQRLDKKTLEEITEHLNHRPSTPVTLVVAKWHGAFNPVSAESVQTKGDRIVSATFLMAPRLPSLV